MPLNANTIIAPESDAADLPEAISVMSHLHAIDNSI